MKQTLFSLQGFLRIALIAADGSVGPFTWAGDADEATLELDSSNAVATETSSGQRLQIGTMPTGTTAKLNMTLKQWSSFILAQAFRATQRDIVSGTVTGEVFPDDLVVGNLVRLDHPFVSALVITDSTGTPVTVDAADYALVGHGANMVEIKDLTGYVQPLKAAYSYAAAENLVLFSAPSQKVMVQFDGINTENNEPVVIDVWKAQFDPVKSLGLINKEYGNLPLTAPVLYDPTRAADSNLGGFARMLTKKAT